MKNSISVRIVLSRGWTFYKFSLILFHILFVRKDMGIGVDFLLQSNYQFQIMPITISKPTMICAGYPVGFWAIWALLGQKFLNPPAPGFCYPDGGYPPDIQMDPFQSRFFSSCLMVGICDYWPKEGSCNFRPREREMKIGPIQKTFFLSAGYPDNKIRAQVDGWNFIHLAATSDTKRMDLPFSAPEF